MGHPLCDTIDRGEFECHNVTCRRSDGKILFQDASFAIPQGASVGVYGPPNSGKSALLQVLAGRSTPATGRVSLNGTDLRSLPAPHLRKRASFVPRHPLLFAGSIADNIAYSCLSASFERIVTAAQAVGMNRIIARCPHGYDTQVGSHGELLTGTQRQLIALARQMVKSPELLAIDNPMTMTVDGIDNDVLAAVKRVAQNRTTFISSPDLNTLRHCNYIVKIEAGRPLRLLDWSPPVCAPD